MPYKDPERKKEWERLHRPQRQARRRELRLVEATEGMSRPEVSGTDQSGVGFLVPLVAGGALAAYNPMLGIGIGGLTIGIAAMYKKRGTWWIAGVVILVLSLFFYLERQDDESRSGDTN
jgi:hypothetical protein